MRVLVAKRRHVSVSFLFGLYRTDGDQPLDVDVELVPRLGEIGDAVESHGEGGNLKATGRGDGDGHVEDALDVRVSEALDGRDEAFGTW